MAPTSMCETCKAIPFQDLPSVEQDGLPHLPSYDALENSAKDCPLCSLLCYAVGCSFVRLGGMVMFAPMSTLPSGKQYRSEWDGSMHKGMMRAMENGAVTLDFSPIKADLSPPRCLHPRDRVKDGSLVRPWLFGSWYKSPFSHTKPWLIGLGVRLGRGPRLEDAVGLVDTSRGELKIHIPGTALRIRADETAYISSIIPGRLRTQQQASKRAISRVKTWIDQCDQGHRCAAGHSCVSDVTSPVLPTRVLDVNAQGPGGALGVRLIESHGVRDHYIAVSHCWGSSDRLTTLKSNILHHLEYIPFGALAVTFQDAVVIARELDVKYVWIDSLCIIQDDHSDWEREAVRMGDVYSNAYLTVAALGSSDDADGIFVQVEQRLTRALVSLDTTSTGRRCLEWAAPLVSTGEIAGQEATFYRPKQLFGVCDTPGTSVGRDPPRVYVTPEWMPASTKPKAKKTSGTQSKKDEAGAEDDNSHDGSTETYLIGEFGGTVDPFADEPLSMRGWTLQERILSRRTLHYGSDEMYWECQALVMAEDGALLRRTFPTRDEVLESRAPVETNDQNDEYAGRRKGRDPWYRLVEEYCARSLTRAEDKLPALAGLASSIALRSGDTYLAGLWQSDILNGLNWSVEVNEPTHQCDDPEHDAALPPPSKEFPTYPHRYRAPSWSWAAFDAKIKFYPLNSWRDQTKQLAEFVEARVDHAGDDPFGMVTRGWMKLRAPLCIVRQNVNKESSSRRANREVFTQSVQLVSKTSGTKVGSALFDDAVQLPCFAVAFSESVALLLEPHYDEHAGIRQSDSHSGLPTFRRIGRASCVAQWKQNVQEPSPAPATSKPSGLAERFGRMVLGKKKESGNSRKLVKAGPSQSQPITRDTTKSLLWDRADGSIQTIVLY